MKIHPATGAATVDHFVPKSQDRRRAYDWDNFRLAASLVNSFKDEQEVIDPFTVDPEGEVWFVLNLLTFEVAANPKLADDELRRNIALSIERLHLNEPTFCENRRYCHDRYLGLPGERGELGPWPLSWLEDDCPFVARELRRQGRLRAEGS